MPSHAARLCGLFSTASCCLLQRIRAAARRRVARMLRQQATRALRLLDDRLLADIGLKRDDIAFVLRLDEPRDTYAPEAMMFCRASLQS